jgi:cellulose biosynthesis protein BcsQ
VPSHPDLDADEIADTLEQWASAWAPRPIIVDNPGAHFTTDGVLQAADLVIVPVPPSRRAIAAVQELTDPSWDRGPAVHAARELLRVIAAPHENSRR